MTVYENILNIFSIFNRKLVGNKAKGRISKRVFQENKTNQIFQKTSTSYPLIRTRMYACKVTDLIDEVSLLPY